MKNKFILLCSFCLATPMLKLFGAELSAGLLLSGTFNYGWKNSGTYAFTQVSEADPTLKAARTLNQEFLPQTGLGLFLHAAFNDWYVLAPKIAVSFQNGIKYYGNYTGGGNNGYVPLTGFLSYSWLALDINLLNKFIFAKPSETTALYGLAGPVFSVALGQAVETYTAENKAEHLNKPYPASQKQKVDFETRFNAGLSAGIGATVSLGAGYITADMRTTWYFMPSIATYPANGKNIFLAKPWSLNLGYGLFFD